MTMGTTVRASRPGMRSAEVRSQLLSQTIFQRMTKHLVFFANCFNI